MKYRSSWLLWLLPLSSVAQTPFMSAADVAQAEKDGARQYRVSGTITETTSGDTSTSSNMASGMLVEKKTMRVNAGKSLTFSGIGLMTLNKDNPDLCQYDLQISNDGYNWVAVTASGNYQRSEHRTTRLTASAPGLGSCTSNSWGTFTEKAAKVGQQGYVMFCYSAKNKWASEVIFNYDPVTAESEFEDQTCVAGHVETKHDKSQTDSHAEATFGADNTKPGSNVAFDGKKFSVTYSLTKTDNQAGVTVRIITTARLDIEPLTNVEAFFEPIGGMDTYKQWLPQGPDAEQPGTTGNKTFFSVYLRDRRKPGQRITTGIKQVRYTLSNVSHEPGYAMNFPADKPGKNADLWIGRENEIPNPEIEKLALSLTAVQDPAFVATVQSFDYGAYGRLKATVVLDDGTELTAQDATTNQPFMPVPYRQNPDSRIADAWKEEQKATDLSDTDDTEKGEDNVGDHPGDGLSLYEEYRGFIQKKKHLRTDALKKDLLICNRIEAHRDRSEDGIRFYQSVTHIVPHPDFRPEEFGRENLTAPNLAIFTKYGVTPFKYDRIINFNSSPETHVVDQHGMLMEPSPKSLGAAFAVQKTDGVDMSTLKNWLFLVIPADFDPTPAGYVNSRGKVNADGTVTYQQDGKTKIITDFYASRVAHEMLHYSNVSHHGETDCWKGLYTSDGKQILFYELTSDGLGVDRDQDGQADASPVRMVIDNGGGEILPTDPQWVTDWAKGIPVNFVAQQGGQHSGFDDCLMRYDVANIYAHGSIHYFVQRPVPFVVGQSLFSQLTGRQLCTSADGTGVNGPGFRPRSRSGNASVGNCKHQVCINDKYH